MCAAVGLWTAVSTLALCGQRTVCQKKGRQAFYFFPEQVSKLRDSNCGIYCGCHTHVACQSARKRQTPHHLTSQNVKKKKKESLFAFDLTLHVVH